MEAFKSAMWLLPPCKRSVVGPHLTNKETEAQVCVLEEAEGEPESRQPLDTPAVVSKWAGQHRPTPEDGSKVLF